MSREMLYGLYFQCGEWKLFKMEVERVKNVIVKEVVLDVFDVVVVTKFQRL